MKETAMPVRPVNHGRDGKAVFGIWRLIHRLINTCTFPAGSLFGAISMASSEIAVLSQTKSQFSEMHQFREALAKAEVTAAWKSGEVYAPPVPSFLSSLVVLVMESLVYNNGGDDDDRALACFLTAMANLQEKFHVLNSIAILSKSFAASLSIRDHANRSHIQTIRLRLVRAPA